jgi:hypothetical protein
MRAPKICVYCGKQAPTSDHVIPRCLLEKPFPPNLPTVPSCRPCNEAYSKDEEYFLAVMAQSGFVPSLADKVKEGGIVDRMLERSARLDADLAGSMNVAEDGRVYLTPNETRMANVVQKVAFGLYCKRYIPKIIPALNDFFVLKPVHNLSNTNFIFMMAHDERFRPRPWKHVQTLSLPDKTKVQVFDYMFVRNWVWNDFGRLFCIMRFHETVWAAVRCPHPPKHKNYKRRVETVHSGQEELF